MDPCKIAFITEALEGFTLQELHFLANFIQVKLNRLAAMHNTLGTHSTHYTVNQNRGPDAIPTASTPTSTASIPTPTASIPAPTASIPAISPVSVPTVKTTDNTTETETVETSTKTTVAENLDEPIYMTANSDLQVSDSLPEPEVQKSVKWADVVVATQPKKVYPKTPNARDTVGQSGLKTAKTPQSERHHQKRTVDRHSPASQPRNQPYLGSEWKSFCGDDTHDCVYTFRDRAYDTSDTTADNCGDLDSVRFNCGRIYDNQLYVRGWNPDFVNWETVRERLWEELADYQLDIHQIFINSNGFGFITLSNHDIATKCQRLLLDLPSFYGDTLLVNFATARK